MLKKRGTPSVSHAPPIAEPSGTGTLTANDRPQSRSGNAPPLEGRYTMLEAGKATAQIGKALAVLAALGCNLRIESPQTERSPDAADHESR